MEQTLLDIKNDFLELDLHTTFETKRDINNRVLDIQQYFGIGLENNDFELIPKKTILKYKASDVIYICGDSGGGKSTILKKIESQLKEKEKKVVNLNDIELDNEKNVIDFLGDNTINAIKQLSYVGLDDAFIFISKVGNLSDGQKMRLKIAKCLEQQVDTIIIDEFCAILDRETAKVVSFLLQKVARKNGIGLCVATTHLDLFDDLNPNVIINKSFGNDIKIDYNEYHEKKEISFSNEFKIENGTWDDYLKLHHFHYRGKNVGGKRYVFKMTKGDDLVGVIVYSSPQLNLRARSLEFPYYINNFSEVNNDIINCSRVIIIPKYRGIGLASKLLKETLYNKELEQYKIIELLSVMCNFSNFPKKAGMNEIVYEIKENSKAKLFKKILCENNFDFDNSFDDNYLKTFFENMESESRKIFIEKFQDYRVLLRNRTKKDVELIRELSPSHKPPLYFCLDKRSEKEQERQKAIVESREK